MKLSRKQAGAVAALIVALATGAYYEWQAESGDSATETARSARPQFGTSDKRQRFAQREKASGARTNNTAGDFDYYSLVLSWSPTYCATRDRNRPDRQCDVKGERGYAFVLHGLWPQYTRGYPESCWTPQKPFVPRRTIDGMLDIMPNPGLVIHEYRKHGTCSGLTPDRYYALSRQLFNKIKIPQRYVHPTQQQMVSPDQLKDEFAAANPGLSKDMMAVSCRGSGNRLREVRFCFSRDGVLRACGRNENQRSMCSAKRMFVPPVRVARGRR